MMSFGLSMASTFDQIALRLGFSARRRAIHHRMARGVHFIGGLLVILPAWPLLASECLNRPADQITVVTPGLYDESFETTPLDDFHVYDMRGTEFTANEPIQPITIKKFLNNVCVVGPRVVGQQSRELTWEEMKHTYDGDGVRFVNKKGGTVGRVIGEGLWVDNVEDGFEPVRYSRAAGKGYSWTLKSSYFRYIRDDVIENDACHPGEVIDILVDNSRTFISARPSRGKELITGDVAPLIKVHDSVIHVGAANEGAVSGRGGGRMWKWPGSSSSCDPEPILEVRDTIFRVDLENKGAMEFPEGTYENTMLVWLGGGEFPAEVPPGVTVTNDIQVWQSARTGWLSRHRCDANGDICEDLVAPAAVKQGQ
ncbi:MAG: hypothetical protein ACR2Q4_15435 [Geminicoccaceae bacterium]